MRSPWKLFALVEAIALIALFVFWPGIAPEPAGAVSSPPRTNIARTKSALEWTSGADPEPAGPVDRRPLANSEASSRGLDELGIVLAGRILDEAGAAVPDAGIWFSADGERLADATSDAAGGFAVSGLLAGEIDWGVRAEGFARTSGQIEVATTPLMQRHDFVLGRATIVNVRLETDTGRELMEWLREQELNHRLGSALTVVATKEPPTAFEPVLSRIVRTELARFRSRGLFGGAPADLPTRYTGQLSINGNPPVYASALLRNEILATAVVEPGMKELVMTISEEDFFARLCTVSGRVVDDATGGPLVGARVEISDSQSGGPGVTVGEDGSFRLEHARPGLLEVEVTAPDRASWYRWIRLRGGDQLDLGEIRLTERLLIKGTLIGPDGGPGGVAVITWRNLDDEGFLQDPPRRSSRSDADGKFEIHRCARGRIVVSVHSDETPRQVFLLDTRGGVDGPVELQLRAGAEIAFKFTGTPYPEAFHWILDDAGNPVGRAVRAYRPQLTLASGRYRLESVLPSGRVLKTTDFTVAEQATTVTVHLP